MHRLTILPLLAILHQKILTRRATMISHSNYGDVCRHQRQSLRISLSKFAEKYNEDKSSWSKMERGQLPPPKSMEILERYFNYLEFPKEFWQDFLDLASVSRGEIPGDLQHKKKDCLLFFKHLREA